jgi:hypothetical protein
LLLIRLDHATVAVRRYGVSPESRSFLDFHTRRIPKYYERPVLLAEFLKMEALLDGFRVGSGG